MCGIFCSIYPSGCTKESDALGQCHDYLCRRGPDHFSSLSTDSGGGWKLKFAASVLWTQGETICKQPCQLSGNILCWNGDVFAGPVADETTARGLSDTETVSRLLLDLAQSGTQLYDAIRKIHGPYCMIYLNQEDRTLWFGRDPAGRHSLLWGFTQEPQSLTITSVAPSSLFHMKEVPALGLFQVHLSDSNVSKGFSVTLHPWHEVEENDVKTHFSSLPIALTISSPISKSSLFSRESGNTSLITPPGINVNWLSDVSLNLSSARIMEKLLEVECFKNSAKTLLTLLEAATSVRVSKMRRVCSLCMPISQKLSEPSKFSCSHTKVAVLFSGGLDSAILASLASKFVPEDEPIDLLNVAFEKSDKKSETMNGNRKHGKKSKSQNSKNHESSCFDEGKRIFNVPDRLTGWQTLKELQNLFPKRKWNFVEIDVFLSELQELRSKHISNVIHPLKTVLDDSLGCALWFATRGEGTLYETQNAYTSPARIVLIGMGADEQFGGYMRHRTALLNGGWGDLQVALDEDVQRIPMRNLGRDDRVASDHGRQPRLPYLDESVMNFVKSLPAWERCCPNHQLPRGIGDKLLLRLVAWLIGFRDASLLPKRAMQFGSRIANSRDNAAHASENL